MPLPGHIFREYDIRGIAGRDLGPEGAEAIARGFGAAFCRGRLITRPEGAVKLRREHDNVTIGSLHDAGRRSSL